MFYESLFYGTKTTKPQPRMRFLETIKKGKRNGRTRYYCKNCRNYFTDRREHISQKNMFVKQAINFSRNAKCTV